MGQEYSNPARADDPHALPDIEVFHSSDYGEPGDSDPLEEGFYWWSCFPGCLPDGEPMGPFDTYEEALADAREGYEDEEEES